jgi:predicted protein tyrosine phosphatase
MSTDTAQNSATSRVPWEWIKEARDIVKAEPRKQPEWMPVELLPWLYLSNMPSVLKLSHHNPMNITAVLTTNKIVRDDDLWGMTAQLAEKDIAHGYVGGVDIIGYDMMKYHWEDAHQFIDEALSSKDEEFPKIVVHCAAGTNRSALIAGAAMIAFGRRSSESEGKDLEFLEVISILKKQRGFVLNNVWFIRLLAEFAQARGQLGPKPDGHSEEPLRKSELIF